MRLLQKSPFVREKTQFPTERWHGDYHLNYNYEAPFYAVFSSNHPQLSDCYFAPIEEFMERGRKCAREHLGCNGLFYPVGLLPKGLCSEYVDNPADYEKMFLGQKSNASYAAVIMVMRWNATRDTDCAEKHIYPYLKAVGEFWEEFLVFESGRYVIYDDATNSIFPCAVRLGINPHFILTKLKQNYKKFQQSNLLMLHGGGCLENCCLTAVTLNEMALQSYDGIISIFPNWDKSLSCSFKNLCADGAFLVSAKFENGETKDIEILSKNGGKAVLKNPYKKCILSSDSSKIISDELIEINMEKNQLIKVFEA